jgi:hypothetical protein
LAPVGFANPTDILGCLRNRGTFWKAGQLPKKAESGWYLLVRKRTRQCRGPLRGPTLPATEDAATMGTWSTDETWFVRVGVCYCGNPAADHGVVRDFAAAYVLIHRLDARDGFESGLANVVYHSAVQR